MSYQTADFKVFEASKTVNMTNRRAESRAIVRASLYQLQDMGHYIPSPLHLFLGASIKLFQSMLLDCMIEDGHREISDTFAQLTNEIEQRDILQENLKIIESLKDLLPGEEVGADEKELQELIKSSKKQIKKKNASLNKLRKKQQKSRPGTSQAALYKVLSSIDADPKAYFSGTFTGNQVSRMLKQDPLRDVDNPARLSKVFQQG
jgi:hypothetical protein